MIIEYDCERCGTHVRKHAVKGMNHRFCSRPCWWAWQKENRPVTREWLYQKYIVEELDCTQISKIVKRDSKHVWSWLREYGIPTRKRGTTGNWKHSIGAPRQLSPEARAKMSRIMREARLRDGHVPYLKNGVHHLKGKRGAETPHWKGGVSPERQAFYGTPEWKRVARLVKIRDKHTCQRCELTYAEGKEIGIPFDIHHIVSFAVRELRCEISNLILLCERCHYWIHSKENTEKELLGCK